MLNASSFKLRSAPELPWRTHRQLPAQLVVAVTLLVGLAAALSIWSLHHHADERRQAQVVLARIDGLARHLPGTQWYSQSQHEFTPGLQTNMAEVQRNLDDALATLARLDGTSAVAQQAATGFARYK